MQQPHLPKAESSLRIDSQTGVFIVLVAVTVLVLALLVAVVLALGLLTSGRATLQYHTNLAALAAVEQFFRNETTLSPALRAQGALDRAKSIMAQNKLVGAAPSATGGEIGLPPARGAQSPAPGGTMRLGAWHQERPLDGTDPCALDYPCFVEAEPPSNWPPFPIVNAVKLETKTQNPIVAPLRGVLGQGQGEFNFGSTSIAAVVPRCTVFLLDVSLSTTNDSHPSASAPDLTAGRVQQVGPIAFPGPPTDGSATGCAAFSGKHLFAPPFYYLCPRNLELFAYNYWLSHNYGSGVDFVPPNPSGNPCLDSRSHLYISAPLNSIEGKLWCNMQFERIRTGPPPPNFPPLAERSYLFPDGTTGPRASCFQYEPTPYGVMLIDKCKEPQPLADFMLGFNAGVRMLEKQRTAADRVRMSAFRGAADVNPFPTSGFLTDPSILVQLTNLDFRGVLASAPSPYGSPPSYVAGKDPVHPNFIDRGWFPIMTRGNASELGTNIVAAIQSAMSALANSNFCPSGAQKSIVLATDGISTCAPGHVGGDCGTDFSYFQQAEDRLLVGPTSILSELKQKKIALTTLLAGGDVGANVDNRQVGGHYLNFREAVASGYRGLIETGSPPYSGNSAANGNLFIESRASCGGAACPEFSGGFGRTPEERQNEYAFTNASAAGGILFRRPNGLFAHMSIESGGIFCPLLPKGTSAQYEIDPNNPSGPKRLKDDQRLPNQPLGLAPYELSPGETAAECVRQTLGASPFTLVDQ